MYVYLHTHVAIALMLSVCLEGGDWFKISGSACFCAVNSPVYPSYFNIYNVLKFLAYMHQSYFRRCRMIIFTSRAMNHGERRGKEVERYT